MDFIKQWVMCICISLVISAIFSTFTPKGRMKSLYKMVISLFVFLSFLYPFKEFNLNKLHFDSSFKYEEIEDLNNKAVEKMISNQVTNTLNRHEISGVSVSSRVDYNNGEIDVKSVSVAIPDMYHEDDVKTIIFDDLGINAEVHRIGY